MINNVIRVTPNGTMHTIPSRDKLVAREYTSPIVEELLSEVTSEEMEMTDKQMKQGSIEWLYNNLKSHFEHDGDLLDAVKMSFEQAKAMHKEEIMEAHYADRYGCFSKDYYNETFNTK